METRAEGEATGSYESRNEMALRSTASDPTAEPRYNPPSTQGAKSSHTKKLSKIDLEAARLQPESSDRTLNTKCSEKYSTTEPEAGQLQLKGTPNTQIPQENAPLSKSATNQAMIISLPEFIIRRNELFDKLKRQRHAEILQKEKSEINIVLDLGLDKLGKPRAAMSVAAKAWESTPGSFLKHVEKDVSSDVVVAKVDEKELWDLDRPLEYDCRVSYVPFSSPEGRHVFWHSSAHVLGEACECHFNCLLSHGPPVEQGFFYDMAIADR